MSDEECRTMTKEKLEALCFENSPVVAGSLGASNPIPAPLESYNATSDSDE